MYLADGALLDLYFAAAEFLLVYTVSTLNPEANTITNNSAKALPESVGTAGESVHTYEELRSKIKTALTELFPEYFKPSEEAIQWCWNNAPDYLKSLSDGELWESMRDLYYKFHRMNKEG